MRSKNNHYAQLVLRIAIALSMLSAVADRLGFWGSQAAWGNWENFEKYTAQLTFFLPDVLSKFSAYAATFLEIILPLMLLIGYQLKWTALATAGLLCLFAVSMSLSLGIKAPLDYSVWIAAAAAFYLSVQVENPKEA